MHFFASSYYNKMQSVVIQRNNNALHDYVLSLFFISYFLRSRNKSRNNKKFFYKTKERSRPYFFINSSILADNDFPSRPRDTIFPFPSMIITVGINSIP